MTREEIIAAIDSEYRSDEDRFRIAEAAVSAPYDLPHAGKGRSPIFHSGDGPMNDRFKEIMIASHSGLRQVNHNENSRRKT